MASSSSSSPSPLPPLPLLLLSPPSPHPILDSRISPSILLIILILAIIFFVSGLLHLLVRCLLRPTPRLRHPDPDPTALQGQLRQLFHLHDGGVDQSFIDTLPVFPYKAILGVKDPFDCAVCLCEFEFQDKLRLLPKCSHAFHVHCIDTWLLSHSTCPLCRFSLLNAFNASAVPLLCVLQSSRDMGQSLPMPHSGELGLGVGSSRAADQVEVRGKGKGERIVTVKLGKFRNVDEQGEGSSVDINDNNANLGSRRCFSMGSFAYVLDETTSLHVPIRSTPAKKPSKKKPKLPGYSTAMSEYGSDSMREFQVHFHGNGNASGRSKRDSFSISKIWMRGEKGIRKGNEINGNELGGQLSQRFGDGETLSSCSVDSLAKKPTMKKPTIPPKPGGSTTMLEYSSDFIRGFQQHTRANGNTSGRSKRDSFSISKIWKGNESSRRTISEIEIDGISEGLSQRYGDEETQSCYSVDSQVNPTSSSNPCNSNKRTLLWLMGRHNKLVHNHSLTFSSNL